MVQKYNGMTSAKPANETHSNREHDKNQSNLHFSSRQFNTVWSFHIRDLCEHTKMRNDDVPGKLSWRYPRKETYDNFVQTSKFASKSKLLCACFNVVATGDDPFA